MDLDDLPIMNEPEAHGVEVIDRAEITFDNVEQQLVYIFGFENAKKEIICYSYGRAKEIDGKLYAEYNH